MSGRTAGVLLSEVKQCWAWSVLGWETQKLFALIALLKWPEFLHTFAGMWQTFVSLHLALAQLWQPVPHTFALPQMFAAFFASITHTGSCIDVCLNTSFLT